MCACVRACACVRVRACACASGRAWVKHLAKNWVKMSVLVYNRECMLQINHIFGQSDHHLGMIRSSSLPLSLMLKMSG